MRPAPVLFDAPSLPLASTVPCRAFGDRNHWQALNCPACGEPLEEDRDGTSCGRCGGLLVERVWAERSIPDRGRPALPPVYLSSPRELACPQCLRAMAPVLCHGVASWSCARCRWLFFDGSHRRQLATPDAPPSGSGLVRELSRPSLLAVVTDGTRTVARRASTHLADALGIAVLAALVVGVIVFNLGG